MRILFASNLFGATARGGAERIVEREVRALLAERHEVTVVSAGRAEGAEASADGLRVIRYVAPNLYFYADDHRHGYAARLAWHLLDMLNGASARRFAAILRAEAPDAVHTHNLMGLGFLIPAAIRREQARRRVAGERPLRHVHTVHDVQLLHPSGLLPQDGQPVRGVAQRAYVAVMRRLMGSPDAVLFPSVYLRGLHERLGFFPRADRRVVMNPVPDARRGERTALPLPRFLFAGQLERHKGVPLLLAAWKAAGLYAAYGATLEIAGDGSLAAELRAAAVPGVSFLGKLDADAMTAAYDRASFLVMPSTVIENQPTVILESLSRGTPVLASRTGGTVELLTEGETGFGFPPGDVAALSATLRRAAGVAEVSSEWEAMSAACVRWAAARGTPAHVAAITLAYAPPV